MYSKAQQQSCAQMGTFITFFFGIQKMTADAASMSTGGFSLNEYIMSVRPCRFAGA
jgi:hypothetical protein